MPSLDDLAVSLGGELGAQAARIERDLKNAFALESERLRAARAEFELRIERAVADAKKAEMKKEDKKEDDKKDDKKEEKKD